jgi:cysteine synthase
MKTLLASEITPTYNNMLQKVGNTSLVKLRSIHNIDVECYIKLEGENPTGSVKDRTALALIQNKIRSGELTREKTILDSSSGSFACAISYFGKILGFPVKVVTSSKLTEDKKNFISYFGAELISYGNLTIEGNTYCREVILPQAPQQYCFLDQLHNWANPRAHYESTAPEIWRDLEDVDAVAFSLGSGGTLNGITRFIKDHGLQTKIIAVTSAANTKIPGTGSFVDGDYVTPFIGELFDKGYLDYVAEIDLEQAKDGVRILRNSGFFVGIQTGAVYQGMCEAITDLKITGKVLMISGDAGWKNMDKLLAM